MNNQIQNEHDDTDIIELFKHFESTSQNKANMDWTVTTDFKVFSEFLINDVKEMQEHLKNPDDEYLYYVCQHLFNILDWIKLIVEDAGFPTFATAWEDVFYKNFGDKHILQNMYNACFEKWLSTKNGQHKIGGNCYNILEGNLYYHDRFGQWFKADKSTAFDLKPNQELIKESATIDRLNMEYKETWYDAILKQWKNNEYQGRLEKDFLQFDDAETTPDAYYSSTLKHIKTLLQSPVSIAELERWYGGKIDDLEHLVKLAGFALDITQKRRGDSSHTLYLLRDCLMFYEIHTALDILEGEDTSSDQILIGRKLLSNKPGDWGYYAVTLDALYNAHLRYPDNFTDFYNEYARLMDLFASVNPNFAAIINNLVSYVNEHIQTNKDKIVIFDIGFQGSIALLAKYIIDRHIKPASPGSAMVTDVEIGVGAEWSKKLFGRRHDSDYFPMLNRIQLMARSDKLYHYIEGSINTGQLRVKMGDQNTQHQAAMELAVLVMVAYITEKNK